MAHAHDLYVEVRLLAEPSLWCWEIRDRRSRSAIVSSWEATWTAYPSQGEAFEAGIQYLRQHVERCATGPTTTNPERLARAS